MNTLSQKSGSSNTPKLHLAKANSIQPKLHVNRPGDKYEQEADAMADKVMRMPANGTDFKPKTGIIGASIQRKCVACEEEEKQRKIMRKETGGMGDMAVSNAFSNTLNATKGSGLAMAQNTRGFMENAFSTDFNNVRIHNDSQANKLSQSINAKAFTLGNDIYFGAGQYAPNTYSGKSLLAHELTHVVQQKKPDSIPEKIQRTTIGEILNEFFSPISSEHMWNMGSSDDYTTRVIAWQPVIDKLAEIRSDIIANCGVWNSSHRTDSSWVPTSSDPPVRDPNSYQPSLVAHPPGTDPDTCGNAFLEYVQSGLQTQTNDLYTCSIGSFNLYLTVDSIDCTTNNAVMNIWMYNNMSRRSFGRFAEYAPLSGMANQYMWWHWNETISWPAPPSPAPIQGPVNGLVTASALNIRSTPNTSSSIIGRYNRNTIISVICQTNGSSVNGNTIWFQTDRGYVSSQYVLLAAVTSPRNC